MAWNAGESDYDKLYDRIFSVYGMNPENIGIGGETGTFLDNYSSDLTEQFGGGEQWTDWWSQTHEGGDSIFGGTFDPKDYWRSVLNAYFSGTDDPTSTEWMGGDFDEFYDSQIKSNFMSEGEGSYKDQLGYWQSGQFGGESLGKMEYRGAKESALEKAMGTSKKYQHGVGKAGFAGGSRGGIIGESSMWDEYIKSSEEATGSFAESQRASRESWLDSLLEMATSYSS